MAGNLPKEVWLRVAGGGTSLPSGKTYTTMVGDDRPVDRHTLYIRADYLRDLLAPFVNLRDQNPVHTAKIIHKDLDGLTPIELTVTKGQFIHAYPVNARKR